MDSFLSNLVLQLEDDAGSDILEDGRSTCFFKFFGSFDKFVLLFIDKKDWSATNSVRLCIEKNIAFSHQKARCLWPTNQLMR